MQLTPDEQWRRLTAQYAEMWDDELLNLAADYKDLTEIAQQVLRAEMTKRKLGDPTAPVPLPAKTDPEPTPSARTEATAAPQMAEAIRPVGAEQEREWQRYKQHYAGLAHAELEALAEEFDYLTLMAQHALREEMLSRGLDDPEAMEADTAADAPIDEDCIPELAAAEARALRADSNEWWVRVVETDAREKAKQYATVLADAGIQPQWRVAPSGAHTIEVPADQAEEAERLLARPIPQSVIEDSKLEAPEFEMPRCPRCRASDPVLLSADPTNTWRCESCGQEWTDEVSEAQQT